MKRFIVIGIIASLLISCSSPAATPTTEPTREEPKKSAPVDIVIDTATTQATYTPIPATFTLTPTHGAQRTLTTPGKLSGTGSETIQIVSPLPQSIEYTTRNTLGYFLIFSDGTRTPMTSVFSFTPDNPLTAIQVIGTGDWTITLSNVETPTSTATRKPTLKPTVRVAPTVAVISTKKPTAVIIPTVFIPPTAPAPAACCKRCTPGKSKPCGDSCISLDKTCNKGPGCAC